MQIATGTVSNGHIILDGISLADGTRVAVVARGSDESFMLSPTQEDELAAAIAQIESGDSVSLEELLRSLPPQA